MSTTERGVPYPSTFDVDNVPADLLNLAEFLDAHLPWVVADKTERDSLFSDAPVDTLVFGRDGNIWRKISTGWFTVYEPASAWANIPLVAPYVSYGTNWEPKYRKQNGRVTLTGLIKRSDNAAFDNTPANQYIGLMPLGFRPPGFHPGLGIISSDAVPAGRIQVNPDGKMVYLGPPTTYIGLHNISYYTD